MLIVFALFTVRRRRQIESIDTYKTYTNWYKARSNNFKSAYRATKDRWVDTGNSHIWQYTTVRNKKHQTDSLTWERKCFI